MRNTVNCASSTSDICDTWLLAMPLMPVYSTNLSTRRVDGPGRWRWPHAHQGLLGPSGPTAHRRFTEWTAARMWVKLHRLVLDELGARGELDWSRCAIDSVSVRAA